MLVKSELINKIKDYFDLNVYETKVWLALLGKGIASAGEVADISGVPRSRTYDVLESLEKKGFAIVKLGKPVKYMGVKPKMILERLKINVRKEAEERMESLTNIKETDEFSQLEELYTGGIDPVKRGELSAALKGRSNISNYLTEVLDNAKEEVIICTSAEEMKFKVKLFKQTFDKLIKAGINIKLALTGETELIASLSEMLNLKVKKVDLNVKFFIVDRKEILFYLSPQSSKEDSAIWLDSEFFSEAFATLFEKAMKGGKK
jgi:HTH-type transcriptional regulator, sugar sensing transcriptional regulator